jgi:hypothetical protein
MRRSLIMSGVRIVWDRTIVVTYERSIVQDKLLEPGRRHEDRSFA